MKHVLVKYVHKLKTSNHHHQHQLWRLPPYSLQQLVFGLGFPSAPTHAPSLLQSECMLRADATEAPQPWAASEEAAARNGSGGGDATAPFLFVGVLTVPDSADRRQVRSPAAGLRFRPRALGRIERGGRTISAQQVLKSPRDHAGAGACLLRLGKFQLKCNCRVAPGDVAAGQQQLQCVMPPGDAELLPVPR